MAHWTRPNGLEISRVRVPLGVIGIIYELRPNVTAKRGGALPEVGQRRDPAQRLRESSLPPPAIANALSEALVASGLPEASIQLVPTVDRSAVGLPLGGLAGDAVPLPLAVTRARGGDRQDDGPRAAAPARGAGVRATFKLARRRVADVRARARPGRTTSAGPTPSARRPPRSRRRSTTGGAGSSSRATAGRWREMVHRSALTLKLLTSRRPARSSPRRRPRCPSRSAARATGTTATPGSATRRSRSTGCCGSASPRRRRRSWAG